MLASTAFFAPIRAIKELVSTLYTLDERMVSIQKVLDNANMAVVFQQANAAAMEYGRTLDGTLQSLGEIAKLGFNQQDAQKLNANAMLLSTVGEFKNDAEAADYLIAIMRQYKFEVKDTTDVVSALNEVSNKTGADTTGLAQGISKSSSAAAMAGVSFNELNGMMATTIETLKISGNEAGNFYKALSTRFMRGSTQSFLSDLGIQVKDAQGNLLSLTKVLQELGQNWSNYSSQTKNAIAMQLGGVYHINKVSSLIENQSNALKYAGYSASSYGSAQKELATFQEGLQYKTNQMIATFQTLALTIGNNGAKGALVGLIETVIKMTEGFTQLTEMTNGWNLKLPLLAAGIYGAVKAFELLRLAITGVKLSFGWIGIAVIGLETLTSAFMGLNGSAQANTESLTKTAQASANQVNSLQSLINQYNSLKSQSADSTDTQKELQSVLQQIKDIAPQLIESTGKYGDTLTLNKSKTDKYIASLKEMTKEQIKQAQTANSIEIANVNVDIDKAKDKLSKLESTVKDSFEKVQGYQKKYNVSGITDAETEFTKRKIKLAEEQQKALESGDKKRAYQLGKQADAMLKEHDAYIKSMQDGSLKKYADQVSKVQELESKKKGVEDRKKAIDDLTDSTNKNTSAADKQSKALSKVAGGTYEATDGADGLSSSADGVSASMDGATDSTNSFDDALKNAKGSFSDTKEVIMQMINAKQYDAAITASQNQLYSEMSDKLSPVNGLLEDLAQGHAISAAAAMELIQKVPELTKYITIEGNQVKINTQGIVDYRDAQISSYQDVINAEKVQIDAQSKGLKTKLKNYGVEIQAILSVAQANEALAEAEKKHADNINKINGSNAAGAMHASVVEQNQYNSVVSGVNKIKDAYSQLDQLSAMASTGLTQVGTSAEKTSNSEKQSTYITDKYKQSMEQLSTALEKVKNLQQQYPNSSQAYRNALQQEIDLLKQQKELTDNQAKNLQSQISSGHIIQTGMISGSSSSGGGSSANYASGGSTQAQIWNFLKGKGLSDTAIAGIMGNLQVESGFNTTIVNKSSGATGLAQWLGSRLTNLKKQSNWTSLDTQLNFLWSEWAPMMQKYGTGAFNGLSADQAAYTFEKLFERSGGSLNSKRMSNAQSILSQFGGSSGSYSGGSGSSSAADAAQALDQAKSDLLGLQKDSMDLESQIKELYLQIVQSKVAEFDNIKKQYDAQIAQYDYLQNVQDKNSAAWMQTQIEREKAYNAQIKTEQDSINYLQQEISYNNQLTAAQKQTLSDDVLQRQQDLIGLEQKLYDTRLQMANEIVDTYKQALTDMKDAATKNIDNMINEINKKADEADYKKKLADAQKSAQDIQNEINKLMLDDSAAAKKRVADLQKQLADQQDSISQMVADNNKKTQIDNLNAQKESISAYYDNMLNDEDKFAQMRTDILKVSNQNIINELNSLSAQVQSNVNILGTSVVNTLIDAINRANGYMGLTTQNSGAIGHIASLDSGGLLPGWGSNGKFLMAHEKELVLNQSDTSNFLKAINLTRDFFSNIVRLPDLSGLKSNPALATSGGINVNMYIDKVTGDANGAKTLLSEFVNGVKRMGGKI